MNIEINKKQKTRFLSRTGQEHRNARLRLVVFCYDAKLKNSMLNKIECKMNEECCRKNPE